MVKIHSGSLYAIASAVLFGSSTVIAKWLLNDLSPWLLAGLLYLGSGAGLFAVRYIVRTFRPQMREAALRGRDWYWMIGATLFGGILGPVFLMAGLVKVDSVTTSLLLNLEGVFAALLAWFGFKEDFDRRIFLGMCLILLGSILLSWTGKPGLQGLIGPLFVAGACLCWAIDNNLTKQISASDALQIAIVKGTVAGLTNTAFALFLTPTIFSPSIFFIAAMAGFFGYGVSLLLFILALRNIGTARTGAYFSAAPFVGAILALFLGTEPISVRLVVAGLLMAAGVWLHLSEHHDHEHIHDEIDHDHLHVHDEHHQHLHSPEDPEGKPHSHPHHHEPILHSHSHFPDIHHKHKH